MEDTINDDDTLFTEAVEQYFAIAKNRLPTPEQETCEELLEVGEPGEAAWTLLKLCPQELDQIATDKKELILEVMAEN